MVNIASPDIAFENSFLPNDGVGLAREEFIIASKIGIHPLAILNFKKLTPKCAPPSRRKWRGWKDPMHFYVDNLAYGIAKIGAAFYPRPVIVRFSDFKTNEYATLLGGELYEPKEENPMIGWRGASRITIRNLSRRSCWNARVEKSARRDGAYECYSDDSILPHDGRREERRWK